MRSAFVAVSKPIWFWQTYSTSFDSKTFLLNWSTSNNVLEKQTVTHEFNYWNTLYLNPCVANATTSSFLSRNNLSNVETYRLRYSFRIDRKCSTISSKMVMLNWPVRIFFRICIENESWIKYLPSASPSSHPTYQLFNVVCLVLIHFHHN